MKSLTYLILFVNIFGSLLGQNTTISEVNLFLIKGNDTSNSLNVSWDNVQHLLTTDFDNTKKTIVFVHGWNENLTSPSILAIAKAFNTRSSEYNIFALIWSKYADLDYLRAVWSIQSIARFVGEKFQKMRTLGYDFEKFHLIGFSLGAHMCGYIGRYMQNSTNYTLPRITGLEPALPLFFPNIFMTSLNASDARFVDVIHTNSKQSSTPQPSGHVDFYPNGGSRQPGCSFPPFSDCNHHRAWQLYAESVTYQQSDKKFQSIKCPNYNAFSKVSCQGTPVFNYMGFYVNSNATGTFYLNTNAQPPYSL